MQFIGVIPARYASSRFPGKPLARIGEKSMIQRVYEQAKKCGLLNDVVVATDDKRIFDHVNQFGKAVMTSDKHQSGTDRCLEAFNILNVNNRYDKSDGLINIQGDEPFISPQQIERVAEALKKEGRFIVTLKKKIESEDAHHNPNIVKVVSTNQNKALYFSRLPIPFLRKGHDATVRVTERGYKHIGLYGFRVETLRQIVVLPRGKLELCESLEQLRWLENGFDIYLEETDFESQAVDTPEDLKKILQ